MVNQLNSNALNTLAKAWSIRNKAGQELLITEHDEDIFINGKKYKSIANEIGQIDINSKLELNRGLFIGAFDGELINSNTIKMGLWNDAIFEIILFNWKNPQDFRIIWGGIIGNIILKNNGYEFELLGYEAILNKKIGRKFSHKCFANLGDENCAIAIETGYKQKGQIISNINKQTLLIGFDSDFDINQFENGDLIFISNDLKQLKFRIKSLLKSGDFYEITLFDELIISPNINDQIEIMKFCGKDFTDCKNKFQNSKNFYGFPHLPGEGVIYASPK